LSVSPIGVELGMVVSGVVCNDNDAPSASRAGLSKVFKKPMERHSVKLFLLSLKNQFSIAQTDRSKIPYTLTSGMVQQYGVPLLRRNPHQTTRPILLKMDFIGRPQVNFRIGDEPSEFFYMPPEVQDRLGQSEGAVSVDENPRI
jgi:hypothetical protein